VLGSLADYIENVPGCSRRCTLAFVYPAIVTLVALAVVIGLLTYVVPQVVQVFANTKQKLPFLTVALIALFGLRAATYGWIVVVALGVAAFLWKGALRVPAVRLPGTSAS